MTEKVKLCIFYAYICIFFLWLVPLSLLYHPTFFNTSPPLLFIERFYTLLYLSLLTTIFSILPVIKYVSRSTFTQFRLTSTTPTFYCTESDALLMYSYSSPPSFPTSLGVVFVYRRSTAPVNILLTRFSVFSPRFRHTTREPPKVRRGISPSILGRLLSEAERTRVRGSLSCFPRDNNIDCMEILGTVAEGRGVSSEDKGEDRGDISSQLRNAP